MERLHADGDGDAGDHQRVLGGQGAGRHAKRLRLAGVGGGGFEEPWQPAVIYPARGIGGLWSGAGERTPETLARLLGRVRADVLCALDEPAWTSALAHRLGLAPSVSAHLSVLRERGRRRRGGTDTRCWQPAARRWGSRWPHPPERWPVTDGVVTPLSVTVMSRLLTFPCVRSASRTPPRMRIPQPAARIPYPYP
ncbi:hypothetical protein SMICM304S_06141 [Streptomyces microflavus]